MWDSHNPGPVWRPCICHATPAALREERLRAPLPRCNARCLVRLPYVDVHGPPRCLLVHLQPRTSPWEQSATESLPLSPLLPPSLLLPLSLLVRRAPHGCPCICSHAGAAAAHWCRPSPHAPQFRCGCILLTAASKALSTRSGSRAPPSLRLDDQRSSACMHTVRLSPLRRRTAAACRRERPFGETNMGFILQRSSGTLLPIMRLAGTVRHCQALRLHSDPPDRRC